MRKGILKKKISDFKSGLELIIQKAKWQSIINKIIVNDLFYILITSGAFRMAYYFCLLNTSGYPDSNTYLNYNANILQGHVDILRTPVYPYFLRLIKLFGEGNLIQNVVLVQSIISFLAIIIFYKIVNKVFINRAVTVIASFIYGIMPSFVNFDKCILTESLSISASILFLYFIVSYLKKPNMLKAILFTLYVFVMIMLRPSFIILLPIITALWMLRIIFYKTDWKNCLSGLVASFFCVLLLLGYSNLNYINNGCNCISIVSNINQIDIIINAEMYLYGNDPEISTTIKSNLTEKQIFNDDIKSILLSKYSPERIANFIKNCIINQPTIYIFQAVKKIYYLSLTTTSVDYANKKMGYLGTFAILFSRLISLPFLVIYILLVLDFIFFLVSYIKSKRVLWFKIILWSFVTFYLFTVIVGAQAEYHRLFVPAVPGILILLFSYFDMIFYSLDKVKINDYLKRS